jgi:hypothetical protein
MPRTTLTDNRRPAPRQQQQYDVVEAWRKQIMLEGLADKNSPLPSDVSLEQLLKEASQKYLQMYDDRWGLFS